MKNIIRKCFTSFIAFTMMIIPIHASDICRDTPARERACEVVTYMSVVSKNMKINWGPKVTAINNSSTVQSASVSLSRTASSAFGVTASTDINMLIAAVNVQAEIKYNTSKTVTITQNISVPPYTTIIGQAGTYHVYGTAKKVRRETNCSVTTLSSFNYDYGYDEVIIWN